MAFCVPLLPWVAHCCADPWDCARDSIEALDRTQPLLPLSTKKPRRWTNEYVRHGTQTLLAALEIASGQVVAQVKQPRTSVNFLRFLKDVVEAFPEQDLHMVLDNLNIHKNQAAQRWLKLNPRVRFHYTPTHSSWVNMVECFFSILGKQGLSHSVHTSKRQLKGFLLDLPALLCQTAECQCAIGKPAELLCFHASRACSDNALAAPQPPMASFVPARRGRD